MDPLPQLSNQEFLTFWHTTIHAFLRDLVVADVVAARQWESLAIATYVCGPGGRA